MILPVTHEMVAMCCPYGGSHCPVSCDMSLGDVVCSVYGHVRGLYLGPVDVLQGLRTH